MLSLRELLQDVQDWYEQGKHIGKPVCVLLEALVNELEMQRPPEVDARITKLTAERDSWERQCRIAERGLAEARAEIGSLHMRLKREYDKSREVADHLRNRCAEAQLEKVNCGDAMSQLRIELVQAQAVLGRLREQLDLERAAVMMGKPLGPEAEAQFEKLNADAENWQLVLGMRPRSRLTRGYTGFYWTEMPRTIDAEGEWGVEGCCVSNPAEALRAIQQKKE